MSATSRRGAPSSRSSSGARAGLGARLRRAANRAVTRVRPHLPPPAYRVLSEVVSIVGAGPVRTVPAYQRVLVVAPHPDDETIGCGGTVAGLTARGSRVDVLLATDGGATEGSGLTSADLGARRRDEVRAACAVLGTEAPTFLGLPDGDLPAHLEQLTAGVATAADTLRPEAVFVPWPLDAHPDHQAVCVAAAQAGLPADCDVWGYEVWAALTPNRIVDVTASWPAKQAALAAHPSAFVDFDASAYLALSRWRSIHGGQGVGYQEAFLVLSPEQLRGLCRDLPGFSTRSEQSITGRSNSAGTMTSSEGGDSA